MKKIIILTGSELRHTFFRKFLGLFGGIKVMASYCEGLERSAHSITEKDTGNNVLRLQHLAVREQSEKEFFGLFIDNTEDFSNPVFLPKGDINNSEYAQAIIDAKPDLLIAYGCSLIREPLLSAFKGRFLNVHLGLSPYYRGSGTNYWPLVNAEPEYVGATFMYIDAGIDTGEIIHQIRAQYHWGDTPSQIGNRLILRVAEVYSKLIINFDKLQKMQQLPKPEVDKFYKGKDFTESSVVTLYRDFKAGLIDWYLKKESERCEKAPIVSNPAIVE